MEEAFYTHARWRVKPGREQEFIEAWRAMGAIFGSLPNAIGHGTLIRSLDDSTLFFSFGPWRSLEDIMSMRGGPESSAALSRATALCDEFSTGNYEVAALVRP
jgi:heme-degrading monooxygenase HmoA